MSNLKVVGGTKFKKEIDPKHYASAENLLNIVFSAHDLIWLDAIKNIEDKKDGEETFSDSFIGTTSMNEVSDGLNTFLAERKKMINKLVEEGTLETDRKFIIFPKADNNLDNGLMMILKVKFEFDEEKQEFFFDSSIRFDISKTAVEKYQLIEKEVINVINSIKGGDLTALYNFVLERADFHKQIKPDA